MKEIHMFKYKFLLQSACFLFFIVVIFVWGWRQPDVTPGDKRNGYYSYGGYNDIRW